MPDDQWDVYASAEVPAEDIDRSAMGFEMTKIGVMQDLLEKVGDRLIDLNATAGTARMFLVAISVGQDHDEDARRYTFWAGAVVKSDPP